MCFFRFRIFLFGVFFIGVFLIQQVVPVFGQSDTLTAPDSVLITISEKHEEPMTYCWVKPYITAFRPEGFNNLLRPLGLEAPPKSVVWGTELCLEFRPKKWTCYLLYGNLWSAVNAKHPVKDSVSVYSESLEYGGLGWGYQFFSSRFFSCILSGQIGLGAVGIYTGRNANFSSSDNASVSEQFGNALAKQIRDENMLVSLYQINLQIQYRIPLSISDTVYGAWVKKQQLQDEEDEGFLLSDRSRYPSKPLSSLPRIPIRYIERSLHLGLQICYRGYSYEYTRPEYPEDYLGNWCLMLMLGYSF